MDCFPACKVCTGKCKVQVPARREASPRAIKQKRGFTTLVCGHTVDANEPTFTLLGSKLGAQPWCDRCGDFKTVKVTRRKVKKDDDPNKLPF